MRFAVGPAERHGACGFLDAGVFTAGAGFRRAHAGEVEVLQALANAAHVAVGLAADLHGVVVEHVVARHVVGEPLCALRDLRIEAHGRKAALLAEIVQRLDEGGAGRIGLSLQLARKAGQATEKDEKGTKAVDHGFHGEGGLF